MLSRSLGTLLATLLLAAAAAGQPPAGDPDDRPAATPIAQSPSPAERIRQAIDVQPLRDLGLDVLQNNPGVAVAAARARAADQVAPQARALPDPTAGITGFLDSPETRVGPQKLSINVSQTLPWTGKLGLKRESALLEAEAFREEAEALKLRKLTEIRRIYWELSFLDETQRITEDFLGYLEQHEEIAQGRYASGVGSIQGVIKLQAEVTRVQNQLIGIDSRRGALVANGNALRDRPTTTPLPEIVLPEVREVIIQEEWLRRTATSRRPELRAADDRIESSDARIRFSGKQYSPDFKVGLVYTFVDDREDEAGKLNPPEDNGQDIFGIQAGIKIPLWRKRLTAGVQEATERHQAVVESRRDVEATIVGELGDLSYRIPLIWKQVRLLEDTLILQADEARESVKSSYIAGTLNVLDLLDAERVLFDARIASARATTDYAIAVAHLEGVIAAPLGAHRE